VPSRKKYNGKYTGARKPPKPARLYVVSSVLRWIEYDPKPSSLRVEFVTGEIYSYPHVPKTVFQALLAARSKGQFFNAHIRDKYRFVHLKHD
jgi:lysyl-tRNA synthetase class 2